MTLTGTAKQDFENWFKSKAYSFHFLSRAQKKITVEFDLFAFHSLHYSMKLGVFQEFFFYKGLSIEVNPSLDNFMFNGYVYPNNNKEEALDPIFIGSEREITTIKTVQIAGEYYNEIM